MRRGKTRCIRHGEGAMTADTIALQIRATNNGETIRMRLFGHTVLLLIVGGVLTGCASVPQAAKCPEVASATAPRTATEAEMNAEHERLVIAYRKNDIATLERHLAPDHVHNNVFGMRQDKQTLLNDMRNGTLVFQSYDLADSQWIIAPDLAIVTGTLHAEATRSGKPVPATDFRYARIFVKRDGAWLEWLFQNTMIIKPPK